MGRLEDKVAFITGAASGIGSACALRFAHEGARFIGFDLNATADDRWNAAVKAAPGSYLETGDVRDEERIRAVVAGGAERFGRIDILVNCAGIALGGPVHLVPTEEWDRVIDVDLKGTLLVCKHVLPKMIEQGR